MTEPPAPERFHWLLRPASTTPPPAILPLGMTLLGVMGLVAKLRRKTLITPPV